MEKVKKAILTGGEIRFCPRVSAEDMIESPVEFCESKIELALLRLNVKMWVVRGCQNHRNKLVENMISHDTSVKVNEGLPIGFYHSHC